MNTYSENLTKVKNVLGSYDAVGQVVGLSGKAVMKWCANGRPPRTEYTGETRYADKIIEAVGDRLEISKAVLVPPITQKQS